MRLPNADQAVVDDKKLTEYCLSPTHPVGRHKARLFAAAIGFNLSHAVELKAALLAAARVSDAVPTQHNGFGQKYEVRFWCKGPSSTAVILSVWLVRDGHTAPQLVTCYPDQGG